MKRKIPIHCAFTKLLHPDLLRPRPGNPKGHPERQIALLAQIIKKTGWRRPVVVSAQSGMIVTGEGRYWAARLLKTDLVPVDEQNFPDEDSEKAHLLADNRLADLAELDNNEAAKLLESIPADLWESAGFDEAERKLLAWVSDVTAKATHIKERDDSRGLVTVECLQSDGEKVKGIIQKALGKIPGVTVES